MFKTLGPKRPLWTKLPMSATSGHLCTPSYLGKAEDLCCQALIQLYMSLLGAVAYLTHTRMDVAVFICALQRHTSAPPDYPHSQVEQTAELDSEEPTQASLQEILWRSKDRSQKL